MVKRGRRKPRAGRKTDRLAESRPEILVPADALVFVPDTVRRRSPEHSDPDRPAAKKRRAGRSGEQRHAARPTEQRPVSRAIDRVTKAISNWLPEFKRRKRRKEDADGGSFWPDTLEWEQEEYDGPDTPGDAMEVTPETMDMAERAAAAHWNMRIDSWQVMATKPEFGGAIWRIETDHGPRSFKILHRPPARSLFSVAAQDYLVGRGARVPALIPTTTGEICAVFEGKMVIATDWVTDLTPAPKSLDGAMALCYGLGEFHRHSQGYVPPKEAQYSSRLARWPNTYRKMRNKITWFEHLARAYPETPASGAVLEAVAHFLPQAESAIRALEGSAYKDLIARGDQAWGLVHQDYGWSNGQMGPGGVWVIDLDGVAFDLGIRDLRKLITGVMDDRGDWDVPWMEQMIKAYNEANPIEPELLQVMLIDMALPNEFYKNVKEIVYDPNLMGPEIDALIARLLQNDARKRQALRELGLREV